MTSAHQIFTVDFNMQTLRRPLTLRSTFNFEQGYPHCIHCCCGGTLYISATGYPQPCASQRWVRLGGRLHLCCIVLPTVRHSRCTCWLLQVDVLVIGAGPTGLGAATRLHQHGSKDWLLVDQVGW